MAVNFKSDNIQKHKDLSDKIKDALEVNGATIKEKESHSAYLSNLPEGIGKKEIEELSKYNSKFVTATHVAVGELAADIFNKDKNIQQVEAEVGYFGKSDTINISVFKEKTYQNHLAKDESEKEVTKHLVMQSTITSQSIKGSGLKAVRESMSEEFSNMFKK
jgi:hypothetical protein